jgi:hypothetical protein
MLYLSNTTESNSIAVSVLKGRSIKALPSDDLYHPYPGVPRGSLEHRPLPYATYVLL